LSASKKKRPIRSYTVKADSHLICGEFTGSIHHVAARVQGASSDNGWESWFNEDDGSTLVCLDRLRAKYREEEM